MLCADATTTPAASSDTLGILTYQGLARAEACAAVRPLVKKSSSVPASDNLPSETTIDEISGERLHRRYVNDPGSLSSLPGAFSGAEFVIQSIGMLASATMHTVLPDLHQAIVGPLQKHLGSVDEHLSVDEQKVISWINIRAYI